MKDLSAVAKTSSALRCETPEKIKNIFLNIERLRRGVRELCILLEKRSKRAIYWAELDLWICVYTFAVFWCLKVSQHKYLMQQPPLISPIAPTLTTKFPQNLITHK